MGICLSKPLANLVRRRLGIVVHPQAGPSPVKEQGSNCFSRTPGQTSTIELSVVVHHSQAVPVQQSIPANLDRNNSKDAEKSKRKTGSLRRSATGGFTRSSSNSFKQRSKSPHGGSKIASGFMTRAPSVASDTSSVMGLMSGFYALASLTAYETKLIPDIWRSCLSNNKSFCDHVLSRLVNRHPELENMFGGGVLSCPIAAKSARGVSFNVVPEQLNARQIVKKKARHLSSFLHRLIITHELDYDRMLGECDNLGRTHAAYFYERGLHPCHWDSLAHCIVQEYKKTHMDCDINLDEKELQQLSWTHFASAVVSAIKEAFEDEVYSMPAPAPTTADPASTVGDSSLRF